jgi:hypothetical protein
VVQGVVTEDGLLDGSVVTGFEEYYIEPASRYLSTQGDTSPAYHTIAYRSSDVEKPPQPVRCASQSLAKGGLEESLRRSVHSPSPSSSRLPPRHHRQAQRLCGPTAARACAIGPISASASFAYDELRGAP